MHKIDLSQNKFQLQRFILLQIVFGLFVILFTYKWAYKVTHVIEQNLVMNLIYGFIGFIILWIVHELIQMYSYSSLIFMFSIHMSYCIVDVFLVALALTSKFKYIQKYDEGLYLYQNKPTQANHE